MANNSLGLGKGLDALIRNTGVGKAEAEDGPAHTLPIADIQPNPHQPRRQFEQKALEELAVSIKGQGILQPILVRPLGEGRPGKYEIVAGERRWRAAQLAGLDQVPVVVRSLTAQETLLAALVENLQREDLNPVEEALGIQALRDEFSLSQDELAARIGKSRPAVANSLRLLSLSEAARADLSDGRLTAGHARALLSVTEEKARDYLRNLILEEHLPVREAEALAVQWKETGRFRPEALEESEQVQAKPRPVPARPKPQSARLREVQTRLSEGLSMKVKVTGHENRGRVSLEYTSREELEHLLLRLGLSQAGPALDGTNRSELDAASRSALQHDRREALAGRVGLALEGVRRMAIEPSSPAGPGGEGAGAVAEAEEDR